MVIRKVGGEWKLESQKTGRNLGTYGSKAGAVHREKQVEFFKNLKKSKGGKGSLRSKVKKKSLLKKI